MTNLLPTIGVALYGHQWQAAMADALQVSDRTVRRWVSGVNALPDGVWLDLVSLMIARRETLLKLATETNAMLQQRTSMEASDE